MWLNLGEDLFFFEPHQILPGKTISIPVKTFFFWDHLILDKKTDSNWSKIDKNLGQDRLMLFPVSKTAPSPPPPPQSKFLAIYAPAIDGAEIKQLYLLHSWQN